MTEVPGQRTPLYLVSDASKSSSIESLLSAIEERLNATLDGGVDDVAASRLAAALRDLAAVRVGLQFPQGREKRAAQRFHEAAIVEIERGNGQREWGAIIDISSGGILLEVDTPLTEQEECLLWAPGLSEKAHATVLSVNSGRVRFRFESMSLQAVLDFAKYAERRVERY